QDISGSWSGNEIQPIEEYSTENAGKLIDKYLPWRNEPVEPLDDFLDQFFAPESKGTDDGETSRQTDSVDAPQQDVAQNNQESLIESLDNLTGLRSVKEKLAVYERVVRFNKMRADRQLPVSATPLHAMFLGSPGTGKTTVAKKMGEMLRRAGMLSKGHVVVRERANLLGQNYNSESEKTLAAIEEAQGGILLIDEAYQLYQPNDPRDPGKFVIETLLTTLADESVGDWMLILAGYPEEMRRMFEMNPGFKSRIPLSNIYTFDDFTETELMEIAENYLQRSNYSLSSDARDALESRLKADYAHREKNFGNARHVLNLIQTEILPAMAARVVKEGLEDVASLTEIQKADIPASAERTKGSRGRVGFVP
ncbi:MAG: AAA family ATPase, partial [Muribaculaceae bacterium]|nr:AAA family ATPase [Muribaculaceae bacterium]